MFRERNFLKPIYLEHQKDLIRMELHKDQERLLLDKGKTSQELMDLARMRYGET